MLDTLGRLGALDLDVMDCRFLVREQGLQSLLVDLLVYGLLLEDFDNRVPLLELLLGFFVSDVQLLQAVGLLGQPLLELADTELRRDGAFLIFTHTNPQGTRPVHLL